MAGNSPFFPTPTIHTYTTMFSSLKAPLWGKGSVEVGPEATQGESRVRRLAKTADTLITQPVNGIHTVYDVLAYAARTHGTRKAFGYRDIVKMVEEEKEVKKMVDGKEVTEKKTWKYFQLSDYKYYSFVEVKEIVSEVARGLLELGLQKDDVLNIYAATG